MCFRVLTRNLTAKFQFSSKEIEAVSERKCNTGHRYGLLSYTDRTDTSEF